MRKLAIITLILLLTGLTAAEPWISEVNVDPQNPEAGEQIEVTATGEDAGRITFLQADYGDGWKTRYCDTFYTCTNSGNPWTFSLSEGESQNIRVRVADSDYAYSDISTRTVSVEEDRERSVEFTDFPSSWTVGESENVEAEAYDSEGELYDQDFKIQVRERTGGSWDSWRTIATDDCYFDPGLGDTRLERCTVDGSFEPDSSREHEMAAFIRTSDDNQQIIERRTFTPEEADLDISITSSDAEHVGDGDVEFSLGLSEDLPSSYSCRVSSNDRITSFDDEMDRDDDDEFSLEKNFDDGSYTWHMGCLDSSGELTTQVVDESFNVDTSEDDYRITSSDADHTGDGDVEFEIGLNRDLPSGYSCRWSDNNRITSLDDRMDRDDDDDFSAEAEFDDGSHTVYFGCLNLNNNLVTNKVSETFSVDTDEGPYFDVEITDTNSPVDEGDDIEVDYRVENTGDEYDWQRIELEVEGDRKDRSGNKGLSSGARSSGTLTWDTSGFDEGDYDITVSSDDDSDEDTVEVSEQDVDYRVEDVDVNKLGGGDVEFELDTNRNLPSSYTCRWSDNNRISTLDAEMDREDDDEFSAESEFDTGSHTVYFGCLNGAGALDTNKVSESFYVNADEGAFFDVEITDTNSPIDSGDTLEVDYRVENTGDEYDSQDIELEVAGSERSSRTEDLSAGSSDTGTLRWFGTSSRSGEYTATISSDDSSDSVRVSIGDGDYRIDDVDVRKFGGGDAEFDLTTNRDLPASYTCRWSDNDRISTLDDEMDRDSGDSYSAQSNFDDGSHTVYFGCLDGNDLVTNKVSRSFTIGSDEEDYRLEDVDVRKLGGGDVEFELDTNRGLPSSYKCRWSDNDRISTFDTEMDRDSSDSYSAQSNFDEGTHTVYFGCMDGSNLVTNKVSRTFTIGSEDYRVSDVEVRKFGDGDVEFDLSTNRNLPSDYSCRWSSNDRISSIDDVMDRDNNDEFSAEANFDEGSHRIYFGCLDDNDQLVTNKVSRTFTIDDEDSELTLSLRSPLNGAERTPPFSFNWRSSYNGEDTEHTVYIRRHGSSGSLFSSQHREAFVGEDTSYRLTRSLNSGSYDWGVEAEADGETERRSSTFVVPSEPADRYDLNVIVEDESGDRVSGATVSADDSTATTNSNGRTSFRLQEGNYRLVASKDNYFPDDRTLNLDSDRTVTLVLQSTTDGDDVFAEFDYSPTNPEVDEEIEFDASSSQGDIVDYRWRFGDGSTGNGREVEHSYSSDRWYNVRLTVEGEDGSTDSRIRTVRVDGEDSESGLLEVNVEDDRDRELEDARVTAMALTPNNYAVRSSDEDTETDRSSSSRSGNYRLGFELDGRDLETFTEYHSGFNRGNWDNIALESSNGDRLIFRYDLAADSRRGTYRNYQASQEVRLSSGEKEVTMILTVNGDEVKKFTSVIDVPDEHEFEAFRDGGSTEYEGRDTRVSSPSIPSYTRYTDEDGEAVFDLSPGRYTVTGTKPGYRPDRRTVDIDEEDDRSIGLTLDRLDDEDDEDDDDDREERQIDITSVQLPASVCKGNNLNARIQVENTGEDDLSFTLSASGLGTETDRTYYLDEGDEDTKIITFSNVQGSGNQVLSFSTGYSSEERTVQVRDCEDEETEGLSSNINPSQIQIGDSIRVNGIVEGTGIQDVQIDIGGRRAQSLSTEPDGRFSTYVYPNRVGQHNLVVRSGERSNTHSIRVLPTVSVNSVTVPNDIFEGDDFEVCGNVESQTAPLVVLRKNGEIVDSKYGNGEVCFERNEDPGEITYQVQAFNRGAYDDESRTVEIMEQGSEVRNFPDQIASVESGSGMVKVDLYNNRDELRNYEIELEGLPRTWIARSRKEVVLNSGERATEYIYFTPKEEGTFEATLSVRTYGEEIYSENIDISSGGVDRQESLWTRFKLWIGFR
jgi:uncharacterized membrane protein